MPSPVRWSDTVNLHGELFSTLDELDTAQAGGDPFRAGERGNRGRVVLFHAEIHAGGITAGAAGAVLARDPRGAVGDGLPVLPLLRGSVVSL